MAAVASTSRTLYLTDRWFRGWGVAALLALLTTGAMLAFGHRVVVRAVRAGAPVRAAGAITAGLWRASGCSDTLNSFVRNRIAEHRP